MLDTNIHYKLMTTPPLTKVAIYQYQLDCLLLVLLAALPTYVVMEAGQHQPQA
jgi:hypothetical protein